MMKRGVMDVRWIGWGIWTCDGFILLANISISDCVEGDCEADVVSAHRMWSGARSRGEAWFRPHGCRDELVMLRVTCNMLFSNFSVSGLSVRN
jgi:hypothetical protein